MSFTRAEGLFRIMALNILVFLAVGITKVVLFLSGSDNNIVTYVIDILAVKSNIPLLARHAWSPVTYMFVHENFMHILFNMLILFWTGKIFCDFLGSKKLVAVYLMGGLAGAVLYIAAYNLFPAFIQQVEFSRLIGASAGVIAVLVAIATLAPDYVMHLLFFGPVRLKYIAIFLVLLYVISIPDGNAGGNISHLGGAALGFFYSRLLKAGTDIGAWLVSLLDFITGIFSGKPRLRTVHNRRASSGRNADSTPRQEVIDAILDKISRSGYSSLSKEEKDILFKASKQQKD